jgi:hypothetical protein
MLVAAPGPQPAANGTLRTAVRNAALVLAVCACLAGAGEAADCRRPAVIRFAQGASSAQLDGGLPRGTRDCYRFVARVGQHLSIDQPGRTDSNVVLQLYRPPWRVIEAEDRISVAGTALPGARDGDDATGWAGRLPVSGTYLLVLGTSRGSSEYRLRIEIRR